MEGEPVRDPNLAYFKHLKQLKLKIFIGVEYNILYKCFFLWSTVHLWNAQGLKTTSYHPPTEVWTAFSHIVLYPWLFNLNS